MISAGLGSQAQNILSLPDKPELNFDADFLLLSVFLAFYHKM